MPDAQAPTVLTPFDGRTVLNATVAIRNAGDGLSQAMKVDPTELHHGEKVYVVIECEVEKVRFDPIKDTDALQRVHMLKAGTATMVDEDLVRAHLDEMEKRIEEHAGITRLPFDDADPDELEAAHREGEHEGTAVKGCPMCDGLADDDDEEPGADGG